MLDYMCEALNERAGGGQMGGGRGGRGGPRGGGRGGGSGGGGGPYIVRYHSSLLPFVYNVEMSVACFLFSVLNWTLTRVCRRTSTRSWLIL